MPDSTPIEILDPTYEAFTLRLAQSNQKAVAPPPRSLEGIRVGLLANGKSNSKELLEELLAELSKRPGVSVTSSFSVVKSSVSIPPRPDDFARLVREADLVITSIGD
jgi:hypothetical protein